MTEPFTVHDLSELVETAITLNNFTDMLALMVDTYSQVYPNEDVDHLGDRLTALCLYCSVELTELRPFLHDDKIKRYLGFCDMEALSGLVVGFLKHVSHQVRLRKLIKILFEALDYHRAGKLSSDSNDKENDKENPQGDDNSS